MTADAIVAISAAVVALVQLVKWAGMRDSYGPLAVIGFSGLGVALWLFGAVVWPPARTDTWPIFAGWVAVALSAAGVFGFTRAGASAVISVKPPPGGGAGSSPTVDSDSWTVPDPRTVYPTAPAHVVLHDSADGHVAFLTTAIPTPGRIPSENEVFRVTDHRPYAAPYRCDSCDGVLDHVAVVDGEWIATSKEEAAPDDERFAGSGV